VPNVNSKILAKVIEYCQFHVAAEKKDEHGKPAKSEDEIKVGGHGCFCCLLVVALG
jgi:S-phase kinase-associated protein 1